VDARAKHGVSPFMLAVWQNNLDICVWLVRASMPVPPVTTKHFPDVS